MQQTHKKEINEKKIELKWFHDSTLFDDATADTKKGVFKSQIAVIIQASWHNNISIFE